MRASVRRLPSLAALLLALAAISPAASATSVVAEAPKKELSVPVSDALGQLRTLTESKDNQGALALVERLSAAAAPTSFDAYVLTQVKAQVLLAETRYAEALAALETVFRLGEASPGFADPAGRLDQLNLIAQLHAQRAPELKEPAAQRAAFTTALSTIRRWQRDTPRITAESRVFAGSVLLQLATLDPARVETDTLREAVNELNDAFVLSTRPSAQTLTLLAAAHLQLGENLRAAEVLELLAEREPSHSSAWSQLQAIYLAAASEAKKPADARRLNLRALHVLERAQAQGQLTTPRDHYTRVALLFNLQQHALAAELLEKGLADGTLAAERRNWELLASAYSQLGREERSLDALNRAVKLFPADGGLEFTLAQTLYQQGRLADAYARAELAVSKPGLEKPGQAKVYLAYLAFELQRYADAERWIAAARDTGDVAPVTLDPLARAVADALRERET